MTGARQARAVERQELILTAATELLFEEGMQAVTHRQVAARAEVPVGSIGYYFHTRDELLLRVLREVNRIWEERFPGLLGQAKPGMSAEQGTDLLLNLVLGGEATPRALHNSLTIAVDCARESQLLQDALAERRASVTEMLTEILAKMGLSTLSATIVLTTIAGSVAVCIFYQREDIVERVTENLSALLRLYAE